MTVRVVLTRFDWLDKAVCSPTQYERAPSSLPFDESNMKTATVPSSTPGPPLNPYFKITNFFGEDKTPPTRYNICLIPASRPTWALILPVNAPTQRFGAI